MEAAHFRGKACRVNGKVDAADLQAAAPASHSPPAFAIVRLHARKRALL